MVEEHAAQRFVRSVLRPQDRIGLLGFASAVWELTPLINNVNKIERGIAQLTGGVTLRRARASTATKTANATRSLKTGG